jgi:uncharacterized DUF497 family protein
MRFVEIVWDLDDDPDGNVQHIAEHDVTKEEAEQVLLDPDSVFETSRSSGYPLAKGYTDAGRYLVVVYEKIDDASVRPITAYEPDNWS